MEVKISQATRMIIAAIKAKKVAMIEGSPAIGKSAIVHQIAEQFNLKVIDLRLSQCDPTDLLGFPTINKETGKAGYAPMDTFPIEGDDLPYKKDDQGNWASQYSGWLLFLDEITSASKGVQAAAYKLILDRMVGLHHLHKNVAIVGAGNKSTDGAIVEEMSTALQSRLIHLELIVDHKEWIDWASANDVDYRITSFINFKPGILYAFKPDHTDKTYASPRTWSFLSDFIKILDVGDVDFLPIAAGTISEGVAREFVGFCKIFTNLPTMSALISAPESIIVPDEPSILFALCGSIAHNAAPENVDQLMKFIMRMPIEFQVVCLRETIRRNKTFMSLPAIQQWLIKSAANLF